MDPGRHQQSLQGILRFAIANSTAEGGAPDPATYEQMEAERKEFLENALKSMTVDVVEELEKAVQALQSESSTVEDKVEALTVVRDYADNLDFANNFIHIGGSKVVLDCLKSSNDKLRITSAYVVAELSQNNPFCQKHFVDADTLTQLMMYIKEDGDVASSSMHAISSLVRNFEEGCAKFVTMGGLECIKERLHSKHCNVLVKTCFLLRALSIEHSSIRDKFIKLGAVQRLATFVDPVFGFDLKIEIVLSALCALTESEEGKHAFRTTNIADVLQTIIDDNAERAECEEIVRDSTALLECLKKDK